MTSTQDILVVDDDHEVRFIVRHALEAHGKRVAEAESGAEAIAYLDAHEPGLILMDVVMDETSGIEICQQIKADSRYAHIPVVFITAVTDQDTIRQLYDAGAADYVSKPIRQHELLARVQMQQRLLRVQEEFAEERLVHEAFRQQLMSGELQRPELFQAIETCSPAMKATFQYMEAIANTSRTVLITGETGVGKELIAQTIHKLSGRKGEFVAVNIAGLDDNLFADSLFGHAKGAFTGADSERPGLIERAAGGTLFLDEIGDIGPVSQVKLLRLLQEREYYPLGSDTPKSTDTRVVAATYRDLQEQLHDGKFRQDLFYRLRTHHVHIPPLRERLCDLPLLVSLFAEKAAQELSRDTPKIPAPLTGLLSRYEFPGNVRELESLIFDAVSRTVGDTLSLVPFEETVGQTASASGGSTPEAPNDASFVTLNEHVERHIQAALERANGSQRLAAELLGISRQALNRRLNRKDKADE